MKTTKDLWNDVSKELFGFTIQYEWIKIYWNNVFEYALTHSVQNTIAHFGIFILDLIKDSYLNEALNDFTM